MEHLWLSFEKHRKQMQIIVIQKKKDNSKGYLNKAQTKKIGDATWAVESKMLLEKKLTWLTLNLLHHEQILQLCITIYIIELIN